MTRQVGARGFFAACLAGWTVLAAAAAIYANQRSIPAAAAVPAAAAFLVEYIFYLTPGFPAVRERFAGTWFIPALVASVLIPYLVYSVPTQQFQWDRFAVLAAVGLGIGLWYVVFPASHWADAGFIAALTCVLLSPLFKWIYVPAVKAAPVLFLGHLFLVHTGAMVMLVQRRFPGIGFGFVPTGKELAIGARNFVYFAPVGAALGIGLGLFHYRGRFPAWLAPGVLVGYYLVVALSEEFAFRGILQQTFQRVARNAQVARVGASLCFGAAHIRFGGVFPNWPMVVTAGVAGWFYGRAFDEGRGIRAAMVTHSLTITVWLVWLD